MFYVCFAVQYNLNHATVDFQTFSFISHLGIPSIIQQFYYPKIILLSKHVEKKEVLVSTCILIFVCITMAENLHVKPSRFSPTIAEDEVGGGEIPKRFIKIPQLVLGRCQTVGHQ